MSHQNHSADLRKIADWTDHARLFLPEQQHANIGKIVECLRRLAEWILLQEIEMSQIATVINGLLAETKQLKADKADLQAQLVAAQASAPDADDAAAIAAGLAEITPVVPVETLAQ